jgi:hypothetical protein
VAARHRLRARPGHGRPARPGRPRYLRDAQHADTMLCLLAAHHSCAILEAEERGLADTRGLEFGPAPYRLSGVLTYWDMTTSPDGEPMPVHRRLAEIYHRYGSEHLVSRSIQRATPTIVRAVQQVQDRAARSGWLGRPRQPGRCLHSLKLTWPPEWAQEPFELFEVLHYD